MKEMELSKRNLAIDWMKGLMILIIVLHHFFCVPHFNHTYLPVDFFFFVAGYFLMRSFCTKPQKGVFYIAGRVKQFYLEFFVALVIFVLLWHKRFAFSSYDEFIQAFAPLSSILSLTQQMGPDVYAKGILDVSWFLSVLIIGSFFVYGLLDFNKKLSAYIILPFIVVVGFTMLFSNNSSIAEGLTIAGVFGVPLLRGTCEIAGGSVLYQLAEDFDSSLRRHSVFVNIIGFLAFLLFLAIMLQTKVLMSSLFQHYLLWFCLL